MGTDSNSNDYAVYVLVDGHWQPLHGLQDMPEIKFDGECKQKVRKVRKVINFFKTFLKI